MEPGIQGKAVQEHYIIDADFHLQVTMDELLPYIDNQTIKNKLRKSGPPPSPSVGFNYQYAVEEQGSLEETHGAAITADEIEEVKDSLGLDEVIIQPTNFLPFPMTKYPRIKTAAAKAYNDYLMENVLSEEFKIYGGLVIPDWDVEASLEELDRYGDDSRVVAAQNWAPGFKSISSYDNDPIHQKITDLKLPWVLHSNRSPGDTTSRLEERRNTFVELVVLDLMEGAGYTVTNSVMSGLFDKFPDLKIVINETGILWLPFLAYRMDEWYKIAPEDVRLTERKLDANEDYLDKIPSEYVFENFYVGTQPYTLPKHKKISEALLTGCQAQKTFLFSTDWPHISMDIPQWVFDNPNIDENLRRRIFSGNAKEVFRRPT